MNGGRALSTLIESLSNYAAELEYEDISERAINTAKQAILDSYGNIICGCFSKESTQIKVYARYLTEGYLSKEQVPLLDVQTSFVSPRAALFYYAAMGRMADMDDGFSRAMGHPGSFLIPALLVMGWLYPCSGRQAIGAIVAAYDVYARIGEAINPSMHRERGFDATGVCGAVAAAALIAKIKQLNKEQFRNAAALAASFSGGLIECQNDGTSGKYLCGAWALMNALQAVELAAHGFTGPYKALEGKAGLFNAFCGRAGFDASHVLDGIGSEFKINDIYFKRYACLRGVHATMDAILSLLQKYNLDEDDVDAIDIRASSYLMRLSRPDPQTVVAAQGSLQFTSAVILKYRRLDSESFQRECMRNNEILELMKKITVTPDDEMEAHYSANLSHFSASKVKLTTKDGQMLEAVKFVPDGESKDDRFGWDMLEAKFRNLAGATPITRREEEYIHFIKHMENQESIKKLLQV